MNQNNETTGQYQGQAPDAVRHALASTGVLRVAINLGNPVLAQGTPQAPRGVTVAIAQQIAAWLGVELELTCVPAARESYATICAGEVDLCFLAIEPVREEGVVFTDPYVLIEGVYLTREDCALSSAHDVDAPGISVGVRTGSAYDLFLSRTLEHATIVRGDEAHEVFEEENLQVCAGIRQPLEAYAAQQGHRVLEPAFMDIKQAVGIRRPASPEVIEALDQFIELLKTNGFVQDELNASGVQASVAPAREA